jgi:hypothetical protein
MSPGDLLPKLWKLASSLSVRVFYAAPVGSAEVGALGLYAPPGTAHKYQTRAEIPLFRPTASLPYPRGEPDLSDPNQALQDGCTLAHEYGHRLSDLQGNRTPEYVAAVSTPHHQWPSLTDPQKRLILDEESRAWSLGREALKQLGCDDWVVFEERERKGLDKYRELLDIQ